MILALVIGLTLLLGQVLGVALVLYVSERIAERTQNLQQFGTPAPPEAVVTREEDAESRVLRVISEDTIQHGIQILKTQVYGPANIPVEDDVLREEAIAMLNGVEPRVPRGLPH